MKWYESTLIQADPPLIEHKFACSSCNRIEKQRQKIDLKVSGPPPKLSLGIIRRGSRAA